MKQQVIVVHGGTTFETYDDFLSYLRSNQIDLDWLRCRIGWKRNLQKDLGENYDVILAEMPNKNNVKYLEWAIYFNKLIQLCDEELILIGNSLGGIFLIKFLSENFIKKKIKALILVASPFDDVNSDESLGDFKLSDNFDLVRNQCEKIFLVHSKDDNVVDYGEVEKYKNVLPEAKVLLFEDKGHFGQEKFEEIVELIRDLVF